MSEQLTDCIWLEVRLTDEQVPETQNKIVFPLTNIMVGRCWKVNRRDFNLTFISSLLEETS